MKIGCELAERYLDWHLTDPRRQLNMPRESAIAGIANHNLKLGPEDQALILELAEANEHASV